MVVAAGRASVKQYNAAVAELIPLFPLQVVLFPENPLPLHIFEPRYREMTAECLDGHKPFGVVMAQEKSFAQIGCTAEIAEVTKRYEDGRMDIMTVGQRRFEIVRVDEERPFLRAEVNFFADDGPTSEAAQRKRAIQLQIELIKLAGQEPDEIAADDPQLSFHLAGGMPLDLDFKQALLAMRSEGERISALMGYYEALLPKLRRAIKTRAKAGGNGHVIN